MNALTHSAMSALPTISHFCSLLQLEPCSICLQEPARQLLEQHFLKIAMPSPGALKETMQSTSRAAVPPLMQLILTLIEEVTVDLQGLQADCTYADYVGIYSQAVMTRVLANARLQQHWHGIAVSMH